MSSQDQCRVLGIPVTSISLPDGLASTAPTDGGTVANNWTGRLRKKLGRYIQGIRQIVRSQAKKSKIVNENLSLSSRIRQARRVDRVFEQVFFADRVEKLLKTSKCYLSTTAGPIAGKVFISTEKVAFHSDKLIELRSPQGQLLRVPYKLCKLTTSNSLCLLVLPLFNITPHVQVLIPQTKIKSVVSSQSIYKPRQKFIQIVTTDNFEFWFMGSSTCSRDFQ